jgi:chromosome segregation ATPase
MTEDQNTKDLSDRELLELMRREINAMRNEFNQRFENVEGRLDQMEGRLGTWEARTNPLPPNYDARFAALEKDVKEIKRDMKLLGKHDWQREQELADITERVERLEDQAA